MQTIIILPFILLVSIASYTQPILPIARNQYIIDSLKKIPLRVLAANYYSSNLPFFCKKELQLQKITKMPIKFRVGSVEEVDRLEGKHTSRL